ncbi:MAG: ribbon-helix-helix protein, CopG family [Betaproteobacteria bacterium]|nr:ribbon-helix-helix protein, CopG family [Betaproteobacteria bacterium]
MAGFSLRLPDDLEEKLDQEARREGVPRSEVARLAIAEFLARRERERFLAAFVAEARAAYGDPAIRGEALAIAEEALPLDNEALDRAEAQGKALVASPPRSRSKRR